MTDALSTLEGSILLFIQDSLRCGLLTQFFVFVTKLGNAGFVWVTMSLILLLVPKTRNVGAMGILALMFSLLVNNLLLKNIVERSRPFDVIEALTPLVERPRDFSFPSGHTASSFAAAGVFFRRLPKWLGVPALLLAVLMGLSRLYVGVHYPTDVLVGLLSGLVLSVAAEKMVDASEAGGGIRDMWRGRRR